MIDYTLSAALFALLLTLLLLCLTGHGYANTVDRLALFLHRHARRVRGMHRERDRVMARMWREPQPATQKHLNDVYSQLTVSIRKKESNKEAFTK